MALLFIASQHGGRYWWLWVAAVLHGLVTESVSYFVPNVDNFWHAQSMIMLMKQRLPLHIALFCEFKVLCFNVCTRPKRLIDLTINRDYWEIIDVQTTIVMSISLKKCHQKSDYASQFGAKCNLLPHLHLHTPYINTPLTLHTVGV